MRAEEGQEIARLSAAQQRDDTLLREIPHLSAKLVVELANGLNVTTDHLRVQADRSRLLRLADVVTGQGHRRRLDVEISTAMQMRVMVSYLKAIDQGHTASTIALGKVADSLTAVAEQCHLMGDAIVDLAEDLVQLRTSTNKQLAEVRSEAAREGAAYRHLNLEYDRWGAGRLPDFSPMQKLFLTVDALYWGAFGDHVRKFERPEKVAEWADHARNKLVKELMRELEAKPAQPLPATRWLASGTALPGHASEAVAFLAEPSNRHQPLSRMLSTGTLAADPGTPGYVSIHRCVDRMFEEVFVRRALL